jgi:cobalt-zinc-cadmium efflux system outer membrane protein
MLPGVRFAARVVILLSAFVGIAARVAFAQGAAISLSDAMDLAMANNPSLKAQRLNIDQGKANEITAGLRPNPIFASSNEDFPFFSPAYLSVNNLATNQEFNQNVTYLFERGGKRQKRVAVARDATQVAAQTFADQERQVRFEVAQAFIGALLAKSNLDFARQDLSDYSSVVEINQKRYEAGDISRGDFLKIELQKLQFQQDVAAAELAFEQSRIGLRQLIGFNAVPENFTLVGTLEHQKRILVLDELQKQALLNRPDYEAARTGVALAQHTVSLAYADRAVDITGETEYKRNGPVNGWGFGLAVPIPVFNRNQGEIARSEVAVRQAQHQQTAAREAVLTDVQNAYQTYRNSEQVLSLFEAGYLEQAQQSLEISRYAFQRGGASLLDLLDAERSYRSTQVAYRQALAAYMTSLEQINFAVGTRVIP